MARTIDEVAEIKHDADQTNHCLDTDTGRAQFGATEQNDLLCITNRNGRSTLCPHDNTGHVSLAGNRQGGDLPIENSKGKTTVRNIRKKFFTKTVVKHVNHTPNVWAATVLAVATLIPLPSLAETPRTVQAWGGNSSGDLGIGVASFGEALPREVVNLNNVKAIAGGNMHSLALLTDGTVRAWGFNQQGQLGDGSFSESAIPVIVLNEIGGEALTGVTSLSASSRSSFALR